MTWGSWHAPKLVAPRPWTLVRAWFCLASWLFQAFLHFWTSVLQGLLGKPFWTSSQTTSRRPSRSRPGSSTTGKQRSPGRHTPPKSTSSPRPGAALHSKRHRHHPEFSAGPSAAGAPAPAGPHPGSGSPRGSEALTGATHDVLPLPVGSSCAKQAHAGLRPPAEGVQPPPDAVAGPNAGSGLGASVWGSPDGYRALREGLRGAEFGRLAGKVYADYAGAPPYPASVLQGATKDLLSTLHGNPHSSFGWEQHEAECVAARVRQLTLALCRADPEQYECVLTAGATGALKLVAEAFPWTPGSTFLYLRDNHNSVLGIRHLAAQRGAASAAVQVAQFDPGLSTALPGSTAGGTMAASATGRAAGNTMDCSRGATVTFSVCTGSGDSSRSGTRGVCFDSNSGNHSSVDRPAPVDSPQHLFAVPLESNMWGVRYHEGLGEAVQAGRVQLLAAGEQREGGPAPRGRWRVLVDAAKGCASQPPDLSRHPADFVALSFYKLFGFPTGVGALLVRKDALECLAASKAYFGGGTVAVSLAEEPSYRRRPGAAGLEDGTLPFLQLPAVLHGFSFLGRLGGLPAISAHAAAVARHLQNRLLAARHGNGARLCVLYGAWPGAGGLLSRNGSTQIVPGSALGEAVLARQGAGGSSGHGGDGVAEQQLGLHAQQDAEHAEQGGTQLEGPKGVHQAIARHKALQRTQVLQHGQRRRRSHQAPPEGAGAHADLPRHATLRRLSLESRASDGCAPVTRTESFGTEASGRYSDANTCFYSPRSSISEDGSASGSVITVGSVVEATAAAAAPAGSRHQGPAPKVGPHAAAPDAVARSGRSMPSHLSGGTTATSQADSSLELQDGGPLEGRGNGTSLPWDQGGEGLPAGSMRWEEQLLRQRGVAGQGPVVAFNVLRADGSYVGYRELEKLGSLHGIFLRTGCMCNPGACSQALGLTSAEMLANYEAGHVCWDDHDTIGGKPTGVVRASFGYASTLEDAEAIAALLERYFLEPGHAKEQQQRQQQPKEHQQQQQGKGQGQEAILGPTSVLEGATGGTSPAKASPPTPVPSTFTHESSLVRESVMANGDADSATVHVELLSPTHSSSSSSQPPGFPPWPESASDANRATPAASQPAPAPALDSSTHAGSGSPPKAAGVNMEGPTAAVPNANLPQLQPQGPPAAAAAGCGVGSGQEVAGNGLHVEGIYIYPIKSCRGMEAPAWPLGPTGLLYDRHWALVDGSGTALTLKKLPALATIQPHIDLQQGLLQITAEGLPEVLELALGDPPSLGGERAHAGVGSSLQQAEAAGAGGSSEGADASHLANGHAGGRAGSGGRGSGITSTSSSSSSNSRRDSGSSLREAVASIRVCSRDECGVRAGVGPLVDDAAVSRWFESALGVPCRLVRQAPSARPAQLAATAASAAGSAPAVGHLGGVGVDRHSEPQHPQRAEQTQQGQQQQRPPRSFANDGQLLLLGSASLRDLHSRAAAAAAALTAMDAATDGWTSAAGAGAAVCACSSDDCDGAGAGAPCAASLAAFTRRFRPNLVVGGAPAQPYCEDSWSRVTIGGVALRSAGGCTRCEMICMDPFTGRREGPEPLLTLAGYRRKRGPGGGKICFGVLFNQDTPHSAHSAHSAGGAAAVGASQREGGEGSTAQAKAAGCGEGSDALVQWVGTHYERFIRVGMEVQAE